MNLTKIVDTSGAGVLGADVDVHTLIAALDEAPFSYDRTDFPALVALCYSGFRLEMNPLHQHSFDEPKLRAVYMSYAAHQLDDPEPMRALRDENIAMYLSAGQGSPDEGFDRFMRYHEMGKKVDGKGLAEAYRHLYVEAIAGMRQAMRDVGDIESPQGYKLRVFRFSLQRQHIPILGVSLPGSDQILRFLV